MAMTYWEKRQQQLNKQMEKDEEKLKKRLSSYFDTEYRKLEKQIAAYYKQYGTDNVIQYRRLMEELPEEDKRLLIEQMDQFAAKYPEYAHLMPVRESIYKLNRLEGLQYSVRMQQLEIGAVENEQITAHLNRQAMRGANAAAEALGFGKNFYSNNPDITKLFVNVSWSNGENFSERIWGNTSKLAYYLNTDIAQGIARGDSYDRLVKRLRKRFGDVSRNDAYRLIYTEGTYVMAESTMQPFKDDFEQYRLSPVLDGKTCPICRGLREQVFEISERQPGINFPPIHPWCRCSWEIVVDDWDKWMDDYVAKHSGDRKQAEKVANHLTENSRDDDYQKRIKQRREAYRNRRQNRSASSNIPDFSSMGRDELLDYAKKNLKTDIGDLKGVNIDFARDTVRVLSEFEQKLDGNTIPGLNIKFGGLSKNVFAKYDDKTNTLALKKTGSKETFEKAQKEANIRFRHKWNTDQDYYSTETYSGTIWHELGHAVDMHTGQQLSRRLSSTSELDELSVKVSGYAGTTGGVRVSKRSEAWAENFAAYMDGGTNKEKVPKEISDMIDGYFKESIAKSSDSGIIKRKGGTLKLDLQFFAEKDIKNQQSGSLKRAIRKYQARIEEHEAKIKKPKEIYPEWDTYDPRYQDGLKRHWNKEIRNFKQSIQDRVDELKERGDYDE